MGLNLHLYLNHLSIFSMLSVFSRANARPHKASLGVFFFLFVHTVHIFTWPTLHQWKEE